MIGVAQSAHHETLIVVVTNPSGPAVQAARARSRGAHSASEGSRQSPSPRRGSGSPRRSRSASSSCTRAARYQSGPSTNRLAPRPIGERRREEPATPPRSPGRRDRATTPRGAARPLGCEALAADHGRGEMPASWVSGTASLENLPRGIGKPPQLGGGNPRANGHVTAPGDRNERGCATTKALDHHTPAPQRAERSPGRGPNLRRALHPNTKEASSSAIRAATRGCR